MNIKIVSDKEMCHYCRDNFNGIEEAFVQEIESGEALYHLRCIGKLMVYRIEGVLPKHLFACCVEELGKPLPDELLLTQTSLTDYGEEQ